VVFKENNKNARKKGKLLEIKIANARAIRKERARNEKLRAKVLKSFSTSNRFKQAHIRYSEDIGQKKILMHKAQRIEMSKLNRTMKILREQEQIKKRQQELVKMRKVEEFLIQKLKATEKIQSETIKQLETAISTH